MSAALVKLQRKGQMVIPRSLREEAGVVEGTLMKVAVVSGGQFLVTPQVSIDRAIVANPRKTRKQVLRELAATVSELRREAKAKGLDRLSMREINATVAAARRAHKTTKPRAK
jgi:bifunctional DNA-binding transcriptional regulator/antitoxin component of YhaV-PrlF toxin-antitoxin module